MTDPLDELQAHWNAVVGSRRGQLAAKLLHVPDAIHGVRLGHEFEASTSASHSCTWHALVDIPRDTIPTIIEFFDVDDRCVAVAAVCCRSTPDRTFVTPDGEFFEESRCVVEVLGHEGKPLPWSVEVRYAFRVDDSLTAVECGGCLRIDQRCKCSPEQREALRKLHVTEACVEFAQAHCVAWRGTMPNGSEQSENGPKIPSVSVAPCRDDFFAPSVELPSPIEMEQPPTPG